MRARSKKPKRDEQDIPADPFVKGARCWWHTWSMWEVGQPGREYTQRKHCYRCGKIRERWII